MITQTRPVFNPWKRVPSPRGTGVFGGCLPGPRVIIDRAKVTKARRGPTPEGQEAPGPLTAQ